MFSLTLEEFNIQQEELHRQAAYHRLVKSLEKPNPVVSRIINAMGKMLIQTGQQLLSQTQPAH